MPCFLCSGCGIVDSAVASDSSHQQLLLNILLFVEKTRMALFLTKTTSHLLIFDGRKLYYFDSGKPKTETIC